jgi:hypothetical protein
VDSIYFEAQTGTIREQPRVSNFYQYRLALTDRPILEAAVAKATPGCGGLEYEPGFIKSLAPMERNHLTALVKANKRPYH